MQALVCRPVTGQFQHLNGMSRTYSEFRFRIFSKLILLIRGKNVRILRNFATYVRNGDNSLKTRSDYV